MKNIAKKLLTTILSVALLAGCAPTTKKESSTPKETPKIVDPVDVNVAALKGPTSMGMVQMMKENDEGKITSNNYKFEILSAVDEVTPKIVKGDVDIAAVPANLASVLYNKMEKNLQVLAINTLGVLYICETGDSIHSVADLKGKTIYASGKGATPEYVLNYILEKNGLQVGTDVTIEWKSEHAECVQALAQDPNAIAMLPQPFV
ncbi:MAG: ABC transporter substrate-binding protein, partial [Solobacterium sp.]